MWLFVYGSLKRGLQLHEELVTAVFAGLAVTEPGYRLYRCGWYPALVECADGVAVEGELYSVDEALLDRLDEVEGVHEGLYVRSTVRLQSPSHRDEAITYLYLLDVTDLPDCGTCWEG